MTNFPPVIGLNSQYPRAGKDTVAGILRDLYGYEHASFADMLRAAVAALDPVVVDNEFKNPLVLSDVLAATGGWEGIKSSAYSKEARRLLRRGGTEMGRQVLGEDVWVNAIRNNLPRGKMLVFIDMRFPNEWDFVVKEMGGEAWRLHRPEVEIPMGERHLSDTALDNHSFHNNMYNDSTVRSLADSVMRRMEPLQAAFL